MTVRVRPAPHTARSLPRRLLVALLGLAHLAILGFAPLLDPAPAPAGHQHHLAAESAPGCQPSHAEDCVLCRVLTGEAVGGGAVGGVPLAAAPSPQTFLARGDIAPDRAAHAPLRARAPPAA